MQHNCYKNKNFNPYFYYPKYEDRNYLISYEEIDKIREREGGTLLFAQLKTSFSEEEAKENYQKIENFLIESMNEEEKEEFSKYSEIKEERIKESSIDKKYWVSAMLDVWSLNCDETNFEIKVGHNIVDGYSVLMYRKKGGFIKEKIINFMSNKSFEEVQINMKDVRFSGGYPFECGEYRFSLGDGYFEMRERDSKVTPLVLGLKEGYTYGSMGEKPLTEFLTD